MYLHHACRLDCYPGPLGSSLVYLDHTVDANAHTTPYIHQEMTAMSSMQSFEGNENQ